MRVKIIEAAKMWLLVSIVGLLLTGGCSHHRSKIEAVLIAHARAQAKLIRTPKNPFELAHLANGNSDALLIPTARYASALQKIDVSQCPDDFKTAWGNYVAAWQADDGQTNKIYNVTAMAKALDGESPNQNIEPSDNSSGANQDLRIATWLNLKKHLHGALLIGDDF